MCSSWLSITTLLSLSIVLHTSFIKFLNSGVSQVPDTVLRHCVSQSYCKWPWWTNFAGCLWSGRWISCAWIILCKSFSWLCSTTQLHVQLLYGGQSIIMVGIVINRYNAIVEAQKNPAPREIALIQLNKSKLNADTDRNTIVNERGVKESP